MAEVRPDSTQTRGLLEQVGQGDRRAPESLLARYRPRLPAFIDFHLHPRPPPRGDPPHVGQGAQLVVARRIADFLRRRPMPFHLWVRKTAYERLLNLRRDHLRRARRAAGREVALPERSSLLLVRPLLNSGPSPSQQAEAR